MWKSLSHDQLCNSMDYIPPPRLLCPWGFSRQEYWSGLPCLSPGDLPNPGTKPRSPTLQAYPLLTEPPGKPKNTVGNQPIPSSGDLPDPQIELGSPELQVHSLLTELPGKPQCLTCLTSISFPPHALAISSGGNWGLESLQNLPTSLDSLVVDMGLGFSPPDPRATLPSRDPDCRFSRYGAMQAVCWTFLLWWSPTFWGQRLLSLWGAVAWGTQQDSRDGKTS